MRRRSESIQAKQSESMKPPWLSSSDGVIRHPGWKVTVKYPDEGRLVVQEDHARSRSF